MLLSEIIQEIHNNHWERQVVELLIREAYLQIEKEKLLNAEYKASLRIAKKINNGKNKAIDDLCEVEENENTD